MNQDIRIYKDQIDMLLTANQQLEGVEIPFNIIIEMDQLKYHAIKVKELLEDLLWLLINHL